MKTVKQALWFGTVNDLLVGEEKLTVEQAVQAFLAYRRSDSLICQEPQARDANPKIRGQASLATPDIRVTSL